MRSFKSILIEVPSLLADLDALEEFLRASVRKKERDHIIPFFKARPSLCAALGMLNVASGRPDRYAHELSLFGDFVCDVASGDSKADAYTLVEFEAATEHSIFAKLEPGRAVKRYSSRFEHGVSQLVDWSWRLSSEQNTPALTRIFGCDHPTIHFVLIAGRDADLDRGDVARLRWRSNNLTMGPYRMSCYTFDGALDMLRSRLWMVQHPARNAESPPS